MTWLDERLFGWSKSSKRGTSAWLGVQEDYSRLGTPDESDEEDAGDYENVMGFLPVPQGKGKESRQASRSRNNSYADLQKLRVAPITAQTDLKPAAATLSPSVELDGLSFNRTKTRERKNSLSDNVTAERLANEDPEETFTTATDTLNDEIRMRRGRKTGSS